MELDETDLRIINALQSGFPVTSRPFARAADQLGLREDELIVRLAAMKDSRVITRFGPFLDAAAMGGAFCLCAMEVPPDEFDAVTDQVNGFEEVAHNYARDHRLNMWFVLATETPVGIGEAAARIEAATGLPVYQFPKLKEFFVGFRVAA
ncbi:AsnC family transcriptional regulator [uncultured Roseobacter sp.]|uniref:Lrp/AsnC family transcriptional regulator n=1 Tax=uncultured Roseobacter sp. TaxID=114847 RepID=UPI0026194B50|nr:AsnC family transcriptional regulator [uncultured Roseobacter sp.]